MNRPPGSRAGLYGGLRARHPLPHRGGSPAPALSRSAFVGAILQRQPFGVQLFVGSDFAGNYFARVRIPPPDLSRLPLINTHPEAAGASPHRKKVRWSSFTIPLPLRLLSRTYPQFQARNEYGAGTTGTSEESNSPESSPLAIWRSTHVRRKGMHHHGRTVCQHHYAGGERMGWRKTADIETGTQE